MANLNLSPIALFVYNRPGHTKQTIEALQKNELAVESDLIIFSDGPKNEGAKLGVHEVREYLKSINGFRSIRIIERKENYGLAKSIIAGVGEVVNKYGKIIVLEDDLIASPYFLRYMNEALVYYEAEESVISIHGYIYPVKGEIPETFFIKGADCWGWATWKRGWDLFESDGKKLLQELEARKLNKEFDFDGSYPYIQMLKGQIKGFNNSWAIRWYASAFLRNKLTLYPGHSLVSNIGFDNSGIHTGKTRAFYVSIYNQPIKINQMPIGENEGARLAIIKYFRSPSFKLLTTYIRLKFYLKIFKGIFK